MNGENLSDIQYVGIPMAFFEILVRTRSPKTHNESIHSSPKNLCGRGGITRTPDTARRRKMTKIKYMVSAIEACLSCVRCPQAIPYFHIQNSTEFVSFLSCWCTTSTFLCRISESTLRVVVSLQACNDGIAITILKTTYSTYTWQRNSLTHQSGDKFQSSLHSFLIAQA